MEDSFGYEGYEEYEGMSGEVKKRSFKHVYKFSIVSFAFMLVMAVIYKRLIYSIPYIILFYSVLLLIERFGGESEWIELGGIALLYFLLLFVGTDMFVGLLITLPVVAFIWVKEGKKEDVGWFLVWTLVVYILYYSIFSVVVAAYSGLVFPHFTNNPVMTYILLLFPVYYVLFLAYFYHLIAKFYNLLEGEHKLYKVEYAILYSSIYTILLCLITYLTITGL